VTGIEAPLGLRSRVIVFVLGGRAEKTVIVSEMVKLSEKSSTSPG